jgi:peptidoglycan/xylan/chitin deacetylase (PgdA/CDA1 family)
MIAEPITVQDVNLKQPSQFEVEDLEKGTLSPSKLCSQRILEHFRCPTNFLDFSVNDSTCAEASYFRFGSEITCYGRLSGRCSGDRKGFPPYDALKNVVINGDEARLSFNPTEVIDNLRLERYRQSDRSEGVLKKLYYLFRPLTSPLMRRQIQRFHARDWQRFKFPRWPVDTTVENLCEALLLLAMQAKGIAKVPFVWFWPRGVRGCVAMTHDVEHQAGMDFCSRLMDIDDSFGVKASFQIVPEERYRVSSEVIDEMRARGFEVGIHDLNHDGQLFEGKEEFLRRAAIVNRYAREYKASGFRAAVLYRRCEWYDILDFSYDMSIPNVAHLDPQRGGCCTVMPYFIGNILELPLTTIQDYTLFHILNQRSIDLWKTQLDLIFNKNGLASFIIHPDYIIEPETRSVYRDLLTHITDERSCDGIWLALPREIDKWWRTRSRLRLEKDGQSWRIVGEGAERATLAYAKNIDDKLVYELPEFTRSQ